MTSKVIILANLSPLGGVFADGKLLTFSIFDKDNYALGQTFVLNGESFKIERLDYMDSSPAYYLFILS